MRPIVDNVLIPLPLFDKRWRSGEERFVVPTHVFDPRQIRVEQIATSDARRFIKEHHYSHNMPPARCCVGVYEGCDLVGALAFTVPMAQSVIPKWLDVLPHQGIELGRMVMLDRVGFNAESYVIARAIRILRRFDPALRGIVSFADPMERRDPITAQITKPAHSGTMYRASNATFRGRSGARWISISPNGTILSPRALSKIRNEEQGRDYAERDLVAAGIDRRQAFESGADWLKRVLPTLQRAYHPGNLAYTFALGRPDRLPIGNRPGPNGQ